MGDSGRIVTATVASATVARYLETIKIKAQVRSSETTLRITQLQVSNFSKKKQHKMFLGGMFGGNNNSSSNSFSFGGNTNSNSGTSLFGGNSSSSNKSDFLYFSILIKKN